MPDMDGISFVEKARKISPESGFKFLVIKLNKVDFPQPFAPISVVMVPSCNVSAKSSKTFCFP